jgi:hypothetical protein
MKTTQTTILISEEDAARFIEFQRNYEVFKALIDAHVLNIADGSFTCHFSHDGLLQNIETHLVAMRRRRVIL